MLDPRFAILGAALVVLGELAYVVDVLRHQVRPNRVSWAVWTVPPLVCFIAQVDAGVGAASLLSLGMGIGALLVLLASFRNRHAYARLGPLDWSCALLAAVSAVIWAATNDVNTTVITVGAIDWLAALPIFVKAYRSPSSESGHSFLLCALGAAVTLLALQDWRLASYGVPMSSLLLPVAILAVIAVSRRRTAVRVGRPLRGRPLDGDRFERQPEAAAVPASPA